MCFKCVFLLLCFCLVLCSSSGSGLKGGSEDLETGFQWFSDKVYFTDLRLFMFY